MKHYKYGSSTAARTNQCQAWQELSKGIPRKESPAAARGTRIHDALEQMALSDNPNEKLREIELPLDEQDLASELWDAAMLVLDEYNCNDWEPEVTGEAGELIGGTLDLVGRSRDCKTVVLLDYKTGQGVQVEAEGNDQLLFAAAVGGIDSCVADWINDAEHLIGVILQPDRNGDVQAKVWNFKPSVAEAWWYKHRNNIATSEEGNAEPCAGKYCTFCPAEAICPAKTGQVARLMRLDPEKAGDLAEALGMIDEVKSHIRAVEKMAFEQLEVGCNVPGYKLVRKRSNRKWRDENAALKALRGLLRGAKVDGAAATKALLQPAKLQSPAQVEKLFKKVEREGRLDMDELTVQPPGELTIAREDDKREAVPPVEALKNALDQVA